VGSKTDWAAIIDKKDSPKVPRHLMFSSVRVNTNASNNRRTSDEDQTDNYVKLERRSTIIETFTALEGYVAQSDICLSFNDGDCCALLRKTDQNWWLVNIGGKEGWVPGSYWEPSSQVSITIVW